MDLIHILQKHHFPHDVIHKIELLSQSNESLYEIVVKEKLVDEEKLLQILHEEFRYEIVFAEDLEVNFDILLKIPFDVVMKHKFVPIRQTQDEIVIVISDPFNKHAIEEIKNLFPKKQITVALTYLNPLEKLLFKLKNREKISDIITNMKRELAGGDTETSSALDFIMYIFEIAIEKQSSDIHIETEQSAVQIRFRIDGILHEMMVIEKELFNIIATKIKLLANLNITEKRKPQDGRFSIYIQKNSFDCRISTLPIATGESIVIRILDKRNVTRSLEDTGISTRNLNIFRKALQSPNGIILVTGPTGSGKTTTLYAALNEIKDSSTKIITVEDPVEYQLKMIQQVQVNEAIGLSFANALRSILRQDPDIIMVGEIRDTQTLEIAIKAALTGHLVISTLHTNDAISSIDRMIDMGADPFMVAAAVEAVEAQRLVRKICPYCKVEYKPSDVLLEPIRHLINESTTFYRGRGCEHCHLTGYKGRTMINEVMILDDEIKSVIAKSKDSSQIEPLAKQKGFESMFIDGLIKVFQGETTLEEVYKAARVRI
ncbi:MAG: type II/IV secretion system protein [Epsilonproteobacteria bacterium]|nr:type II/IV secretion system protein [Campylobacterota bacterium]